MKQAVLLILFSFFTLLAMNAQSNCESCPASQHAHKLTAKGQVTTKSKSTVKIAPNPANEFIEILDNDEITKMAVYNLVGRRMKSFDISEGKMYDIGDLPLGIYLVQMIDRNNKVITTQRFSKR